MCILCISIHGLVCYCVLVNMLEIQMQYAYVYDYTSWFSAFLLVTSEASSVLCVFAEQNVTLDGFLHNTSLLVTDISLNTLDKFHWGYCVCRSCMISGNWSGRRFCVFHMFVCILLSADGTIFLWYLCPSLPCTLWSVKLVSIDARQRWVFEDTLALCLVTDIFDVPGIVAVVDMWEDALCWRWVELSSFSYVFAMYTEYMQCMPSVHPESYSASKCASSYLRISL